MLASLSKYKNPFKDFQINTSKCAWRFCGNNFSGIYSTYWRKLATKRSKAKHLKFVQLNSFMIVLKCVELDFRTELVNDFLGDCKRERRELSWSAICNYNTIHDL